jgi:hypothetical protein
MGIHVCLEIRPWHSTVVLCRGVLRLRLRGIGRDIQALTERDMTSIGRVAFNVGEILVHIAHEIVTPDAERTIKYRAFSYCSGLTTETLVDGLEVIGGEAFKGAHH